MFLKIKILLFSVCFVTVIIKLCLGIKAEKIKQISQTCINLQNGKEKEISRLIEETNSSKIGDIQIDDCSDFVKSRNYFDYPISKEERENPLAYILVVFKDSKQVERLLRSIYRTSNVYCIHVDKKSTNSFINSIQQLTSCLDNVFTISTRDVEWGTISTLDAELDCMGLLHQFKTIKWKYLINLAGQEFPLKSNREIVRITKALNGSNWIGVAKKLDYDRYQNQEQEIPFGLTLYKGPVHGVFCREFVRFVLENETSRALFKWLGKTNFPDESFYPTLNFNSQILHVPGAYSGKTDVLQSDSFHFEKYGNRYKQWWPNECKGFYVRTVCIFSVGDIQFMVKSFAIFANKFYPDYNPAAFDCLEEYIQAKSFRTIEEVDENYLEFYRNQDFVQHHI